MLISSLSSACIQMGLFSAADRQTGDALVMKPHYLPQDVCLHLPTCAESEGSASPVAVNDSKNICHTVEGFVYLSARHTFCSDKVKMTY